MAKSPRRVRAASGAPSLTLMPDPSSFLPYLFSFLHQQMLWSLPRNLLATTEATVHMGGSGGVSEALARLLGGVAQGCPASAMVFCVVAEARAFLALLRVLLCWGSGRPFNWLGYMDDTTWCIDSESDLPVFANNLQKVGLQTNLFSSGPKQLLVVAAYEGFQVTFPPRFVYMGRSRMPVHQGPGYVRVVGRHLFPHVYHKVDKMKWLLSASTCGLSPRLGLVTILCSIRVRGV